MKTTLKAASDMHISNNTVSSRSYNFDNVTRVDSKESKTKDLNAIFEASRAGDIEKVGELYRKGLYPKEAILIGIAVELSSKGSIGQGAKEYFKSLTDTEIAKRFGKSILVVPLNSFYTERIDNCFQGDELKSKLKELVSEDIKKLDGVVIPGDNFNLPPIKANNDPLESFLNYTGEREYHTEDTIYGLPPKEFYAKFPEHKINPNSQGLHYEAHLIKALMNTDKIVMSSCHGTQIYAVMQGAKMIAGIEGHNDKKPHKTEIKPHTMTYGYVGKLEDSALHIHKLGINPDNTPKGIEVVGISDGFVEIIEETHSGRPYYGFQSHPEFIRNHPAIENFVGAVIQRNIKKQVLKEFASGKTNHHPEL